MDVITWNDVSSRQFSVVAQLFG